MNSQKSKYYYNFQFYMESMQPHVKTGAWSKLTRGTKRGAGQYIRHIFSEIDNDIRGRFDIGFDRNLMDSGNWVY